MTRLFVYRPAFVLLTVGCALLLGVAVGISLPWLTLAVLGLGVVGFATLRWPLVALLGLLGTLAVGQLVRLGFSGGGGNLLASDLLLPVVLGVWLLVRLASASRFELRSRLWPPVLAWVAVMALSLLWGMPRINPEASEARIATLYALRWVLYLGAFVLALDLVRTLRAARAVVYTLLGVGTLVALLGFVQLVVLPDFSRFVPQGWDPHVGRLLSTWFDPNFVGGFFALLLFVALGVGWEARGWKRAVLLGTGAVLLVALLLTYSRSAYVGLLVGGTVFALLRARWLFVAGAFLALLVFVSVPRIQERVIGVRSVDETAQLRIVSWTNALEVVRDHPLTGVGYNAYRAAQVQYGFLQDSTEHSAGGSDSSLLTVAVTTGIPGLVVYLWLLAAQFRSARTGLRSHGFHRGVATGTLAGLTALLIHGQFINGLLFPHLLLPVWTLLGVLGALEREGQGA